MKEIKVAFYKGDDSRIHKIIRWWTGSIYSHAELVMPDGKTWISISPFLTSKVSRRNGSTVKNIEDWDFLSFKLSWRKPVEKYQMDQLDRFIKNTEGKRYDWTGMILSQVTPYLIKHKSRWYCSEWIAHALVNSRILMWDDAKIYRTPNLSPGKLYEILKDYKPTYR